MATKRTIRTHAQRLEDAKKEIVRLEQESITKAVGLHEQAEGWRTRAAELVLKAQGADERADKELVSLGHDPKKFWAEYSAGPEGGASLTLQHKE